MALTMKTRSALGAKSVSCRASSRPLWLPNTVAPSYLTGKLAGDRGFDPLGLGADEGRLKWYAEAEKTNGRWAMAAVAGILFTEATGVEPKWFLTGAKDFGVPIAPLVAIQFLITGFFETKRYQGWKESGGSSGFLNSFPFDPAGMSSPANAEKEVKNGRLAMVAFIGFAVQALVTRTGPVDGLLKHLANPAGYNITTNLLNLPAVITGGN